MGQSTTGQAIWKWPWVQPTTGQAIWIGSAAILQLVMGQSMSTVVRAHARPNRCRRSWPRPHERLPTCLRKLSSMHAPQAARCLLPCLYILVPIVATVIVIIAVIVAIIVAIIAIVTAVMTTCAPAHRPPPGGGKGGGGGGGNEEEEEEGTGRKG